MKYWAKYLVATGAITTHGFCADDDVARQPLAEGEAIAERPENVTSYEPWRYVEDSWVKDES